MLKEISDDPGFASTYLDYAQGYNLSNRMPLFVRAKVSNRQLILALCSHNPHRISPQLHLILIIILT